jgi:hypothetical protein
MTAQVGDTSLDSQRIIQTLNQNAGTVLGQSERMWLAVPFASLLPGFCYN